MLHNHETTAVCWRAMMRLTRQLDIARLQFVAVVVHMAACGLYFIARQGNFDEASTWVGAAASLMHDKGTIDRWVGPVAAQQPVADTRLRCDGGLNLLSPRMHSPLAGTSCPCTLPPQRSVSLLLPAATACSPESGPASMPPTQLI